MIRQGTAQMVRQLKIGIVGAAFNQGQTKLGVVGGPAAVRDTGFIQRLQELGHDVIDTGDVRAGVGVRAEVGPDGERNHSAVLSYNKTLSSAVQKVREDGRLCVTLGGDHSVAIGTIAGHSQGTPSKQVVALWVDAHADINTGKSSVSGNMHGMPASFLLNEVRHQVNRLKGSEWPYPCLEAKHLVYIGLRDVEASEQKYLDDLGILHFGMRDLDRLGLHETIARSLDKLLAPSDAASLHLSFDIDALDPAEAPSTGTKVRGGLSLREGLFIAEAAHATGRLGAMDLVEVNPDLGSERDATCTAEAARAVILAAAAGVRI